MGWTNEILRNILRAPVEAIGGDEQDGEKYSFKIYEIAFGIY